MVPQFSDLDDLARINQQRREHFNSVSSLFPVF